MQKVRHNAALQFVSNFQTPAVITTFDTEEPTIIACSPSHQTLTGYSEFELLGKTPAIFKGPLTEPAISKELKKSLQDGCYWHGVITNYKKNGTSYQLQLTIVGVLLEGKKYFFALKSKIR